MPITSIDKSFITGSESNNITKVTIPDLRGSQSGVTVASGFDLGQINVAQLKLFLFPQNLYKKLEPYVGLKGITAKNYLMTHPLTIKINEALIINKAVWQAKIKKIISYYNLHSNNNKNFLDLPPEAQTVIADVSFQYGVHLAQSTPKFWHFVAHQNWKGAIAELKSFGDRYPSRRLKEAKLLSGALK